jgi:light-regulated signal transduction histidine kinase (bacteriophytochrome)
LIGSLVGAMLVFALLALFAFIQRNNAIDQSNGRATQEAIAISQSNARATQEAIAVAQRNVAENQAAISRSREFIDFAVDGATRMKGLIQDLLSFSRAGTQSTDIQNVEARILVQRAVDNLKAAIEERSAARLDFVIITTFVRQKSEPPRQRHC